MELDGVVGVAEVLVDGLEPPDVVVRVRDQVHGRGRAEREGHQEAKDKRRHGVSH